MRLGLCCQFVAQPIKFRTTTATALGRLSRRERLVKVSELCLHNANALMDALVYAAAHGIGSFRIASSILPVTTHPTSGYDVQDFPSAWRGLTLTVEVEAKAKELAVAKLQRELAEEV